MPQPHRDELEEIHPSDSELFIWTLRILAIAAIVAGVCRPVLSFNNDGKADVLWRSYGGSYPGTNAVWYMNGTSFDSADYVDGVSDTNWRMAGTGDFNFDGQLDIVWRDYSTGQNAVWYMDGITYLGADLLTTVSDTNWEIAAVDYFGSYSGVDTHVDLLWRHATNGQNAVWFMWGTNLVSSTTVTNQTDLNWHITGSGDFNSDGSTDILWRNYSNGTNAVGFMNGANYSSTAFLSDAVADTSWLMAGADHFDTDGKIDIFWRYNASPGYTAIWLMDGTNLVSSSIPANSSDLNFQVGGLGDSAQDIDADGLPDLWERLHFGNLDEDAEGDYDGDGYTNEEEYENGTFGAYAELQVRIARPQNGSILP